MGLLHFYGPKNQVTSQALSVSYTSQLKKRGAYGDLYEYHRIASKSYSYVGMDERTARACRDAKEAQYTRTFRQYRSETGALLDTQHHLCVASVQMAHDDAGMWHVDVSVNEDQIQFVYGWELNIIGQLFDTSLDYDEPDEVPGMFLQIDRIERVSETETNAYYRVDAPGFDRLSEDFKVMRSDDGLTWSEDAAAVKTAAGHFTVATAGIGKFYMITWKGERSNALMVPGSEFDYTGTLGPLVFFNGMFWRAAYSFSVPEINISKIRVYIKNAGDTTWSSDVSLDCDIRGGAIYFTKKTSESDRFVVKLHYPDYGGIDTNESQTPYVPTADVGDGSIVPISAQNRYGTPGSYNFRFMYDETISGFDRSKMSVVTSDDGFTWIPVTGTVDASTGNLIAMNNADVLKFVKIFYDGNQASCGVATDTYPIELGGAYIKGADIGPNSNIASIVTDGDGSIVPTAQVSTDGGTSWTDLENMAGSTVSQLVVSDGIYQRGVNKLLRIVRGDKTSKPIHVPLTF